MSINFEALARCNRPPSEWIHEIKNPQGVTCGMFRAQILLGENDLQAHFNFSDEHYSFCRKQITLDQIHPIALLDRIEINEEERRKGLGSSGLYVFLQQARKRGARSGFLKVGSDHSDVKGWEKYKSEFYAKCGWVLLQNFESVTVPFMYYLFK